MGVITFNGVSSVNYDIQIENLPNYETPERDYDVIHVPGKNGDIVIDKGSYKNTIRTYNIAVGSLEKTFVSMANDISKWLHSASNYARLEDSYEPDYYRLAIYKDPRTVTNIVGNAGRATIMFDCKPQRFLKTGEQSVGVASGGTIVNPTGFNALPLITVNGNGAGVLNVGAYVITISAIDVSVTLDSELQEAYKGVTNKNSTITLSNGFPILIPGNNVISFSGSITSVSIIPQWWTL